MSIKQTQVIVDPADVEGISDAEAAAAGKTTAANIKVLRDYSTRHPREGMRRIVFRFCTSPIEITGNDRVQTIVLGRNKLFTDDDGRTVAVDTGERETLPAQLVVRAVGYRGVAIPGLPFDERSGTVPHTHGRITGRANEYVVGWIKRGPSGVIGTNKKDSADTVETLLADLTAAPVRDAEVDYSEELARWLVQRQPEVITEDHWQRIDAHERSSGERQGRPRVKLTRVADMLQIART